jgi:predicted oxidoreductase
MRQVTISEKLSLSAIVQGFWRLADWKWSADELVDFMNACIERGITTFDTAEIYADTLCESLMGEAFKRDQSIRKRIELVSKTGIFRQEINNGQFTYYDTTYDKIKTSCKESLKRLNTDYLDLYLIHREDPCLNPWETARALKDLKKEGLIREAGVSNFDPFKFDAMNQAMDHELVTNQLEWNPLCFEHFNSGMIDYMTVNKIHPMIWSPLAGGKLFDSKDLIFRKVMKKIQEIADRHDTEPAAIVYAWIIYHPVGALPISGSNKLKRLDLAIRGLDIKLDHYEWYEIYTASGQQVLR